MALRGPLRPLCERFCLSTAFSRFNNRFSRGERGDAEKHPWSSHPGGCGAMALRSCNKCKITGYFVNFEPQGGGNSSAQGIALGKRFQSNLSPVGAKLKILSRALTGLQYFFCRVPRAMPWADELCPFGAVRQIAKPHKIQSNCSELPQRKAIGLYRGLARKHPWPTPGYYPPTPSGVGRPWMFGCSSVCSWLLDVLSFPVFLLLAVPLRLRVLREKKAVGCSPVSP